MPFVNEIPTEAIPLLLELEERYPRAATGIRLFWGQREAPEFFDQLSYTNGVNRAGFDPHYLKLVHKIKEIHDKDHSLYISTTEKAEQVAKEDPWYKLNTTR